MSNIKLYDDFIKSRNVNEDNFQGGGHDAMGRSTGYYRDTLEFDKPMYFNFNASNMKTGSDEVDVNSDVYKSLKAKLIEALNSKMSQKMEISILGGASAVGSKSYDNKALAQRRADKLKQKLISDIPGIESKVNFKTSGVVGKETKANSPEALKEQFVMVSISQMGKGLIKTNNEVDNTAVDTGFKKNMDNIIKDIKVIPQKRICLRLPANLVDEFKKELGSFRKEHFLKNIPFGVYDIK